MLFGPDLSHFQAGIDLSRVAAEGCQFVICKVSQGATWRDPAWPGFRDQARRAGLLVAGYHMLTQDAPAVQAANCKAALGDLTIPLALDWEESGNSGDWKNFLGVLSAFRFAGLRVVLAYAPRWYWAQQGSPDMGSAGLPLWASRYVTAPSAAPAAMYGAVTQQQWGGYGGLPVALLQFTDRALIAGRRVDCSAFRGTRTELHSLLYPTPPNSEDDVAWLAKDGAPPIPDFYPGAKQPLPDPATALAWATTHAAVARDEAKAARDDIAALRNDVAALANVVNQLAARSNP